MLPSPHDFFCRTDNNLVRSCTLPQFVLCLLDNTPHFQADEPEQALRGRCGRFMNGSRGAAPTPGSQNNCGTTVCIRETLFWCARLSRLALTNKISTALPTTTLRSLITRARHDDDNETMPHTETPEEEEARGDEIDGEPQRSKQSRRSANPHETLHGRQ